MINDNDQVICSVLGSYHWFRLQEETKKRKEKKKKHTPTSVFSNIINK
jgi:hypothetical protein